MKVNNIAKAIGKAAKKLKSPKVLMGIGVGGSVLAVGLAISGTVKVQPIIKEHKLRIKTINKQHTNGCKLIYKDNQITAKCTYTDKEYRKDIMREYCGMVLHVLACYGGSICAETIAIISMLTSYNKISRRAAGYAAALSSLTAAFDGYRKRVANVIGEEAEQKLYEGVEQKVIEKEDGTTEVVDIHPLNPEDLYTFSFRNSCQYSPNMSVKNMMFYIDGVQAYLNKLYEYQKDEGFYLNEALHSLGLDTVSYGQVVGWKKGMGDDCILLKTKVVNVEENGKIVKDVLITFNVAGDILTNELQKIGGTK